MLLVPRVVLLGFNKVIIIVSLSSSNVSSTISVIVIVPDFEPALSVSVPSAKVKSVPFAVAVPVTA